MIASNICDIVINDERALSYFCAARKRVNAYILILSHDQQCMNYMLCISCVSSCMCIGVGVNMWVNMQTHSTALIYKRRSENGYVILMCIPVWIYFNAGIDNILVIVINFMYFSGLLLLITRLYSYCLCPKTKDGQRFRQTHRSYCCGAKDNNLI